MGGSSWLASSLITGPWSEPWVGRHSLLVMSSWVGEESPAGRTGNSAERGLEGAME